jgi:hypothetical protein
VWASNGAFALKKNADPSHRPSANAPMCESDRQWTNGFVESSDEAACEKRREYYADNYMELMTTEWGDA